jgi:hypothetical protein
MANLLALAGLLHLLPRLGSLGRWISGQCQHAPGLDGLVTIFTVLPWVLGAALFGWPGVAAGVAGQLVALHVWIFLHECANAKVVKGPRILKVLNSRVGRFRHYTAVWITALAVAAVLVCARGRVGNLSTAGRAGTVSTLPAGGLGQRVAPEV